MRNRANCYFFQWSTRLDPIHWWLGSHGDKYSWILRFSQLYLWRQIRSDLLWSEKLCVQSIWYSHIWDFSNWMASISQFKRWICSRSDNSCECLSISWIFIFHSKFHVQCHHNWTSSFSYYRWNDATIQRKNWRWRLVMASNTDWSHSWNWPKFFIYFAKFLSICSLRCNIWNLWQCSSIYKLRRIHSWDRT